MGNTPGSGQAAPGEHPDTCSADSEDYRLPNKPHLPAANSTVFDSSLVRPNKRASDASKPLIISTPTSMNGHHSSTVSSFRSHLSCASGSMLSPSDLAVSPSPRSSADLCNRRRSAVHRIHHKSRIGLMPSVKYNPAGLAVNLPSRGSVRIPPADRITPNSQLSVFSPCKSEAAPSTGEVLVQLQHKREKRKREGSEWSGEEITDNSICPSHTAASHTNSITTGSKRRRHDTDDRTFNVEPMEFVSPSPVVVESAPVHQSISPSSGQLHVPGVSPKRDGHLRTAIASSYSSSRRSKKRQCTADMLEDQPLYKRSINMCYQSSSRESSRRGSPAPLDRDSESETGSRISVTPLPSVKNSPRSSPVPQANRYSGSPVPPVPSLLLTPKIEAKVVFPSIEQPISGFVASLEDRAHDDDVNMRRAKRFLGVTTSPTQQPTPIPQIVMPIVKPSINIPDEKTATTLSDQKTATTQSDEKTATIPSDAKGSSSSSSTVCSPANVAAEEDRCQTAKQASSTEHGTVLDQLQKTLDSIPPSTTKSNSTAQEKDSPPPPSYTLATIATVAAEPIRLSTDPAVKQTDIVSAVSSGPAGSTQAFSFGTSAGSSTISVPSAILTAASAPLYFGSVATTADQSVSSSRHVTTSTAPSAPFVFNSSTQSSQSSTQSSQSSTTSSTGPTATAPPSHTSMALPSFGRFKSTASARDTSTSSDKSVTTTSSSLPFTFGALSASSTVATSSTSKPAFTFGTVPTPTTSAAAVSVPASTALAAFTSTATAAFTSTAPAAFTSTAPAAFTFGANQATVATSTAPSAMFSFGASQSAVTTSAAPAAPFAFGVTQPVAAVSSASTPFMFGGSQSAATTSAALSTGFSFGVSQPSGTSAPTLNGMFSATTSTKPSAVNPSPVFAFGLSTKSGASAATPFGQISSVFSATGDKLSMGTASASGFSFGATNTTSSTPFGATTTTSSTPFGATTTTSSTPFGATTTTSSTPFSATTKASTSMFGSGGSVPNNSVFGATSNPVNPFDPSKAAPSPFAASAGLFGATAAATTASSLFGSFGSISKPAATGFNFGGTTTTSAGAVFGQPVTTSAASKPAFNFLSAASTTPFGAAAAANNPAAPVSLFGAQPSVPAFGSTNSASSTPVFGASSSQAPVFGSTQPAASTPNPFGPQATSEQDKPLFNFGTTTAPGFGTPTGVDGQTTTTNGAAMFSMGTSKPAPRRRTRR